MRTYLLPQIRKLFFTGCVIALTNALLACGGSGGTSTVNGSVVQPPSTGIVPAPFPRATASFTAGDGTALSKTHEDRVDQRAIWQTDGTSEGTKLINAVRPIHVTEGTNFKGAVYYVADDRIHGDELWKYDLTGKTYTLVKDIYPGPLGSSIASLTVLNDTLFFVADDGVHGNEVWKSDGTTSGTVMVKDINPGAAGSVYFSTFDPFYLAPPKDFFPYRGEKWSRKFEQFYKWKLRA